MIFVIFAITGSFRIDFYSDASYFDVCRQTAVNVGYVDNIDIFAVKSLFDVPDLSDKTQTFSPLSTKMSTSLFGVAAPLLLEPNKTALLTPYPRNTGERMVFGSSIV